MKVKFLNKPEFFENLPLDNILVLTDYIFEVTASTKVLLEMSRHREMSMACKSSRYTLSRGDIIFEKTGDPEIDLIMDDLRLKIIDMVAAGKKNDVTSLMLPQVYQYRWVVQFNALSLQNFLNLRLDSHAHYHIRDVAIEMYNAIPEEHKHLFSDIYQKKIKSTNKKGN